MLLKTVQIYSLFVKKRVGLKNKNKLKKKHNCIELALKKE